MFSITGLEFCYSEAPKSMKSILQACWLLTVAIGNLIVVIVTGNRFFHNPANESHLFAFLMLIDILLFVVLAKMYKPIAADYDSDSELEFLSGQPKIIPMSNENGLEEREVKF